MLDKAHIDNSDVSICYGLIGYPLEQSFSKKYFDKKIFEQAIGNCRFENFSIPHIADFTKQVLAPNPSLKGIAVTIPYKQEVMRYLNSVEHIPAGLNACNCIKIKEGKLIGYNTDHIGFEKSFAPLLQTHHHGALVLGNGGATEAVVHVLRKLAITYKIVSRSLHSDSDFTYPDITPEILAHYSIIINTTPLGMYPNVDSYPDIPYLALTASHFLYDLVYNPAMTIFLKKGKEQGALIKNGADMLELQAEENWRIWNE